MNRTTPNMKRAEKSATDAAASEPKGLLAVLAALLSCGFFWPSEGAVNGDGLHLAFLWLVALAGACLWKHWQASGADVQPSIDTSVTGSLKLLSSPYGLMTVGLIMFLAGVWLSTWNVFRISGDRRAALNLAFAWTAIAACGCLCRMLSTHPRCRLTILNLIAGLSVGLAVYGIWQSQVYYKAEASAYLEQRELLETETNPWEVMKIQRELLGKGILLNGPGRQLIENRLLHSTEPFGPFALANTLAGILAVGTVLLIGGLVSEWRRGARRWNTLAMALVALGVVAWCLILTKSRTAWVGTSIGVAVLLLAGHNRHEQGFQSVFRKGARLVLMIGIPAGLLFAAGILSGVIDREVLLESSRSLQFRFFYWTGAAGVIAEEPFFGAGPGNFGQMYLPHKPLESSESVSDPHNFLLDAWCFAGVAGFIGILLLVAGVTWSMQEFTDTNDATSPPASLSVVPGLVGCIVLHFGWLWLSGVTLEAQDTMTAAAVIVSGISCAAIGGLPWNPLAPAAACVTLLVHMLGAGGLQITVLGFLLVAMATIAAPALKPDINAGSVSQPRLRPAMGAVAWATAAAGLLHWGLIPVLSSSLQQSIGLQRIRNGDNRGALHAFEAAVAADPLSPTMHQHMVQAVTYSLIRRNPQKTSATKRKLADEDVQTIESACADYIQSDIRGIGGYLMRGRIYQQLHRLTDRSGYIESCVDDLRQVVAFYPTNAAFQLELAVCEEAAGQTAAAVKTAYKAKDIETVNQAWRHSDQFLSTDDLETMNRIIGGGTP